MSSYELIWRLIVLLLLSNDNNNQEDSHNSQDWCNSGQRRSGQPSFFSKVHKKKMCGQHIHVQASLRTLSLLKL